MRNHRVNYMQCPEQIHFNDPADDIHVLLCKRFHPASGAASGGCHEQVRFSEMLYCSGNCSLN